MDKSILLPSAILALGIALGGFFAGNYYYQTTMNFRTVTVKGLAEKDVKANLASWNIRFQVAGNDVLIEKQKIERQQSAVLAFLVDAGFDKDEIVVQGLTMQDAYADSYRDKSTISARYTLNQTLTVRTDKVDLVQKTYPNLGDLVSKGVTFNSYGNGVSYLFTTLNQVKPEMLRQATLNARAAADEFAKNSDSKVGKIRTANQGVFSIVAREEVPDQSEKEAVNKKIRVVSTVEYYLE